MSPLIVPPDADPAIVPALIAPVANPLVSVEDRDLETLRTIVTAAGGTDQVHWAAGMLVTSGSRQVVITSDRGRGWIPAGTYLPADVVTPWSHEDSARWEGLLDPTRVILEFAAVSGGRLTALASTFAAPPAAAAGIPWASMPGSRSQPELLSGPIVSRFELQVSEPRRRAVYQITDPIKQREQALWLAFSADDKAGTTPVRRDLLSAVRAQLDRINHPRWVASLPWEPVIDEYQQACTLERAARLEVRDIPVGELDTDVGGCRQLLAQAYATEAVLALRAPEARGALVDATYAWAMLG